MNPQLEKLRLASDGLLFMSESDYPFEVIEIGSTGHLEEELKKISGHDNSTPIEKQTLDHFFRNSIATHEGDGEEQKELVRRFLRLKETLAETFDGIEVYRIGQVQVDAFIIGTLKDGSYAGLKTKLVET